MEGEGEGLGVGVGVAPGTVAVTGVELVSTSMAWRVGVNNRKKTAKVIPNLIRLRTEMKFVTFIGRVGSINLV